MIVTSTKWNRFQDRILTHGPIQVTVRRWGNVMAQLEELSVPWTSYGEWACLDADAIIRLKFPTQEPKTPEESERVAAHGHKILDILGFPK